MNKITLKNFRCFREEQTARLAPLTLLVGENSTGKTSFMAMLREIWDIAYRNQIPDFKEEPYDLGSFDEIAITEEAKEDGQIHFKQHLLLPVKILTYQIENKEEGVNVNLNSTISKLNLKKGVRHHLS